MNADEFRDYILGFIFYKYFSDRMNFYADEILEEVGIAYLGISENTDEGKAILGTIKEQAVIKLAYFLKPSELFPKLLSEEAGRWKHRQTVRRNAGQKAKAVLFSKT